MAPAGIAGCGSHPVRHPCYIGAMSAILYYIHDPMCSWCWGFAPTWRRIRAALPSDLKVEYVLGGLAPDTDQPMPAEMRAYLQQTWQTIAARLGTEFNFAFWDRCQPRRATYPACRAVIAADRQGAGEAMIEAIQRAYYLQARNPSDDDTLIALAGETGLDRDAFAQDLRDPGTAAELARQVALARALGAAGFPSLVYQAATGERTLLRHDYLDPRPTLAQLGELHRGEPDAPTPSS